MSGIIDKSDLPYMEMGNLDEEQHEQHEDGDSHPHFEEEGGKSILPSFVTTDAGNFLKIALFVACGVGLVFLFKTSSGHKHKSAVSA